MNNWDERDQIKAGKKLCFLCKLNKKVKNKVVRYRLSKCHYKMDPLLGTDFPFHVKEFFQMIKDLMLGELVTVRFY